MQFNTYFSTNSEAIKDFVSSFPTVLLDNHADTTLKIITNGFIAIKINRRIGEYNGVCIVFRGNRNVSMQFYTDNTANPTSKIVRFTKYDSVDYIDLKNNILQAMVDNGFRIQ